MSDQQTICSGCQLCHDGYTGAGVMITTNSKKLDNTIDVILVIDHTGLYNDFGGSSFDQTTQHTSKPIETALKELYEESRTLFKLTEDDLKQAEQISIVHGGKHKYLCYIVNIPIVSCNEFYKLESVVATMSKCFRETSRMTRFPMNAIKMLYDKQKEIPNMLLTNSNDLVKIHPRVNAILYNLFQK